MGFLQLLSVASIPVIKVLLVTALGLFLALDSVSLLGEDARKKLNQLVFYVFNPPLVGSNLADTITFEKVVKLWFMPVNILCTFVLGSALGWIVIKITRPPKHLEGLILGCCSAGNLGNLPIIIIPAICEESGSPFGDSDVCYQYGMAYAALSMAIGAIFIWSYVYNIMRISSSRIQTEEDDTSDDSSLLKASGENIESHPNNFSETLNPTEDTMDDAYTMLLPNAESEQKVSISSKIKNRLMVILRNLNFKAMFAPSTIGALTGFIIGVVPPIRKLIIGTSAPLYVIEESASMLGNAAIPGLTLIMGANLLKVYKEDLLLFTLAICLKKIIMGKWAGLQGTKPPIWTLVGIVAVRYIFLPLLGVAIVKMAKHFSFVESSDNLYQFVLLLQYALPPAMNIGTIAQLFRAGESECSVIMLWTYVSASIAVTLWSTFFLWLLFSVASFPVIKVLLVTALGLFLALDNISILGEDARKKVNQLVFYVFNPSLVGSNLAKTVTWFMPVNILGTFILGSALGWILIKMTRPPKHMEGLILGCCSAGNLGNLPMIIIPAICKEKGSPFGEPDVCHQYGMAYASLSMAIGAVFLWSYVYNIMRISSGIIQKEDITSSDSSLLKASGEISESHPNNFSETLNPAKDTMDDAYTILLPDAESEEKVSISIKIKHRMRVISSNLNFKAMFAPSTLGAIAGFMIGAVALRFAWSKNVLPCWGLKGSSTPVWTVVGIVAVRYIFLPLLGVVVVKGAVHYGLVHSDPLYQFVLLLQFALPPAMNIGTIAQLFKAGQSECSVIMLWTYALASIAVTLWSTFFMWLVS
ncbi:Protein PIN-LIKES 3, partial [Mucuna pruriens]